MRELRYNKKGDDLVCKDCFSTSGSSTSPNAMKSTRELFKIAPEKLEPTGPRSREGELAKYYCFACRYKFTRKNDFQFENCPSCGKEGSIRKDVPMTSTQLLEESGDIFL